MKVAVLREEHPKEIRAPLVPAGAKRLVEIGAEVIVESGTGLGIGLKDSEYESAGASIVAGRQSLISSADLVLGLSVPSAKDIEILARGAILVSFLDPFNQLPLLEALASGQVTAFSMEMIPRTTLAQKMDALSSQANLAGYVAVIMAAEKLNRIFPMMTTPAGTIPPARVFVIGAGVAGLQAIATAKRLGAIVEAFDTRPVVEEQVRSLGGRFVKIDIGETGETEQGYARQLTDEQLAMQREGMAKHLEKSDVVITTAQVFGRRAPQIITEDMVDRMRPGTVVVDMAIETGGNVAGSKLDQEVDKKGVTIMGFGSLSARVAADASQMYSANLVHFVSHCWDEEAKRFVIDLEDEITKGSLVTHQGEICNEMFKKERT
jgi:NAD(P) transhydrogenase subunit alpha